MVDGDPRAAALASIVERPEVPVLIIGGGINGCGLFRELALQGVECLLVDRADFSAGASSKSSRMIHGGLRYLENGEFRLVREALLERNRLIENAPHFVGPLETTLPLFSRLGGLLRSPLIFFGLPVKPGARGSLIVRLGLSFYDFVTRKDRKTPRHFFEGRERALASVPGLHPGIIGAATYWDAGISQAERLLIELLRDGIEAEPRSRALNHVSVSGTDGETVVLRDEISGREHRVLPRIVVNATGAWVDKTNDALGLPTRYMGGTKGSHLVVDHPELRKALGDRMVYYQNAEGRVCIVFGFEDKVILGSTDIRLEDPDAARCDEAEVEYMLDCLRGVFPAVEIPRSAIVYKFCGVRPLPRAGTDVTGKISRDHRIEVLEPADSRRFPLLCLIGGKWTTFRALAAETADRVLPRLGASRKLSTKAFPIGGGRGFPRGPEAKARWIERVAAASRTPPERIRTLLARYGTLAEEYALEAASLPGAESPLGALPDFTRGEIAWVARRDWVVRLADLVCRRTLIAILGRARREALEAIAEAAGEVLGWNDERRTDEVRRALEEVGN